MEFIRETIAVAGKGARQIEAMRGVGTGLAYHFLPLEDGTLMPFYGITHIQSGYNMAGQSHWIETEHEAQALLIEVAKLDSDQWDISLDELKARYHADPGIKRDMEQRLKDACVRASWA